MDLHETINDDQLRLFRAKMLVQRLERLSVDSIWAHKASGVRASLDKCLVKIETGEFTPQKLDALVHQGFDLLGKAAQEIPSPEDILGNNYSTDH